MNIKISRHAKTRMKERGITEEQVKAVFNEGIPVISADVSTEDEASIEVVCKIKGRKIKFIYSVETNTLVTVYPMKG